MVLSPPARTMAGALQVTDLVPPVCVAMPLPPRSLTQVTRLTTRSSAATPARFTVTALLL